MRMLLVVWLCLGNLVSSVTPDSALEQRLLRGQSQAVCRIQSEPQGRIAEATAEPQSRLSLMPRVYRLIAGEMAFTRLVLPHHDTSQCLRLASSKLRRQRSIFAQFQPHDWGLCTTRLPRADG